MFTISDYVKYFVSIIMGSILAYVGIVYLVIAFDTGFYHFSRGDIITLLVMAFCGSCLLASVIEDIAEKKRLENLGLWRMLGFFMFPLGLACVIFKDTKPYVGTQKRCPYCAELIRSEAKVCKYCDRDILK